MGEWSKYKFSDFLTRTKIPIVINDQEKYKRVTIKTKHAGVLVRDIEIGAKIGTKKQFMLKEGQFVLSKIDSRYGAFGIAPKEVDGAIITGNFWAYNFDKKIISIEWLDNYTNSPSFYDICERSSSGITHRKYLSESAFLSNELFLPPIEKQDVILSKVLKKRTKFVDLGVEITHQQNLLKKLRQSILQEAIEGKLTADWRKQNPDVAPATELLKRIQTEKEQLIKDKKIKKQKPLPPITDEEIPFELPEGWAWCRLGKIVRSANNGLYKQESFYSEDGISSLRMYNIQDGRIAFNKVRRVNLTEDELNKYELLENDLLLNRVNSRELVGKTAIIRKGSEPLVYESMNMRLRLVHPMVSEYANRYLLGSPAREYFFNICKIASGQVSVNQGQVFNLIIPLPPLLEQKSIAAKVEKLLVICDQLEQQITTAETHSEELMQAVLKEAFQRDGTS